ncbi:hypothetical protein BC938DRAFT_477713 [Jimgerdemannia flammicorona]|uniref:BTB domain-containing protein n=1 Tax=Jimgerdemannia flammicorona TaxID=994334 RepID=A0A433QNY3_9FUNG|nr:hypothetical protein BC938DRAFT_477713 [Jimgerdemannia flammicorona]
METQERGCGFLTFSGMFYTAHEVYYYEDGDVAVIAEQTIFRVHAVILKLVSGKTFRRLAKFRRNQHM